MRRKVGTLVPLEASILDVALDLRRIGQEAVHGFLLAKEIRERTGARRLAAYGSLYKALERMERAGLLASFWEDPQIAANAGRPRRRFYRVTLAGESALAKHQSEQARPLPRLRPGSATP